MPNYNLNEKSLLICTSIQQSYKTTVSQMLSTGGFRLLSNTEIDDSVIFDISEEIDNGFVLEADIKYPETLNDSHSELL